jgi:hypothetical protein
MRLLWVQQASRVRAGVVGPIDGLGRTELVEECGGLIRSPVA